jgi:hypothetical protein
MGCKGAKGMNLNLGVCNYCENNHGGLCCALGFDIAVLHRIGRYLKICPPKNNWRGWLRAVIRTCMKCDDYMNGSCMILGRPVDELIELKGKLRAICPLGTW